MFVIDIKTKDIKSKSVKTLDKTIAWTERIKDPIVYANDKVKDSTDEQVDVLDYGEDKIKYYSNRIKDESIYASRKTTNKVKNNILDRFKKDRLSKKQDNPNNLIKNANKSIKTSSDTIKTTNKVTKETVKNSKRALEQGRKLAKETAKKTTEITKRLIKASISAIKAIIAGIKSLIGMITAGGTLAVIAIIIICLIGLLCTSIFGIFFSSEKSNNIKMSDCIAELNNEMDYKINNIKSLSNYDEVVIDSNKAEWKDMLAIYAVKISNGTNENEVMTIDDNKKKVLKEVFWDMNSITSEIKTEVYEKDTIDSNELINFNTNSNYQRPTIIQNTTEQRKILHIYINSKSVDDMINKYSFNDNQLKQLDELTSDKYLTLWNSAIYGVYGSSGEITEWKQKDREWSNIKIGTTNSTIGDIGCLVTSIAILIKKSDVPTSNIYPFNPGTFVTALNNKYGFDESGNLRYGAISKVVPNFKYKGNVNLRNKSKSEKLYEIKKYYEEGYYLIAEVKGATKGSQHWVAVDNVTNNTVMMLDPASNSTNMWEQYDWDKTTQFVYFKVEG